MADTCAKLDCEVVSSSVRKELRDVRYQLNADIEALGSTLKFLNIALVPLVLTLGVLALWLWRRRRHG